MRHFFGDLRADLLHKNQVVRPFAPAVESLYHALFADTLICDQTHCGVLKKGLGGLVMAGEPKCGPLVDSGNLSKGGIIHGLS